MTAPRKVWCTSCRARTRQPLALLRRAGAVMQFGLIRSEIGAFYLFSSLVVAIFTVIIKETVLFSLRKSKDTDAVLGTARKPGFGYTIEIGDNWRFMNSVDQEMYSTLTTSTAGNVDSGRDNLRTRLNRYQGITRTAENRYHGIARPVALRNNSDRANDLKFDKSISPSVANETLFDVKKRCLWDPAVISSPTVNSQGSTLPLRGDTSAVQSIIAPTATGLLQFQTAPPVDDIRPVGGRSAHIHTPLSEKRSAFREVVVARCCRGEHSPQCTAPYTDNIVANNCVQPDTFEHVAPSLALDRSLIYGSDTPTLTEVKHHAIRKETSCLRPCLIPPGAQANIMKYNQQTDVPTSRCLVGLQTTSNEHATCTGHSFSVRHSDTTFANSATSAVIAGGSQSFPWQPAVFPSGGNILPLSSTLYSLQCDNWCAKCNASFRMTSDLVYHMRTRHKRMSSSEEAAITEGDFSGRSYRRRRTTAREVQKLKCDLCGETFRERHHLTRHMTSHNS